MSSCKALSPAEPLARFILQKAYFRSIDNSVKHNAFMPNKNGETSVYRIQGLADEEVYQIGREHVASILGKTLLGRADVSTFDVLELSLRVEPEPSPHPLHANIVAWPEEKAERKLLAMELAARAQLHLLQAS